MAWYDVMFWGGLVGMIAGLGTIFVIIAPNVIDEIRARTRPFAERALEIAASHLSACEDLARSLPLPDSSRVSLAKGEEFVYSLDRVEFIEYRQAPRVTKRSGSAVTLALAKGVYYTAAGGKSIAASPSDERKAVDTGAVTFTTRRAVFSGSQRSTQWEFAKLTGWSDGPDGELMLGVSNRQKVSGVLSTGSAIRPSTLLQLAQIIDEEGWDAGRASLESLASKLREVVTYLRNNPRATESQLQGLQQRLNDL